MITMQPCSSGYTTTMNEVIQFIGLKRSGNHAVIEWLRQNAYPRAERVAFHNCVYSPLSAIPKKLEVKDVHIPGARHTAVILSYEDTQLGELSQLPTYYGTDTILPDAHTKKVLLIRDPWNCFASRLRRIQGLEAAHTDPLKSIQRTSWETAVQLWKQYAHEFVGDTTELFGDVIHVDYNRWAGSKRYRDAILLRHFGIEENRDIGIESVSNKGGGSSFDRLTMDGHASRMQIFDRWRIYAGQKEYARLFDDEVVDLSKKIYPRLTRKVTCAIQRMNG